MTEEEKKVIEKLTNGEKIDFNTLVRKFKREGIENFVITKKEYVETVLNLIQKQDKEIEHWKKGFERELENNRKNTCELLKQDLIIREKDKQIDLMAKEIKERNYNFTNKNIKEIKQYFEKKAEQKGE